MNTNLKTIVNTMVAVRRTRTLRAALKEWFAHKGSCPDPEILNFEDWVGRRIDDMADAIHDDSLVNVANLLAALKVQAIGDGLAIAEARKAEKKGFLTDTNCYVEEVIVYASVWLKGKRLAETDNMAELIAQKFRAQGYATDIWIDEEDDTEVTVNAYIDFPLYVESLKKGGK